MNPVLAAAHDVQFSCDLLLFGPNVIEQSLALFYELICVRKFCAR